MGDPDARWAKRCPLPDCAIGAGPDDLPDLIIHFGFLGEDFGVLCDGLLRHGAVNADIRPVRPSLRDTP